MHFYPTKLHNNRQDTQTVVRHISDSVQHNRVGLDGARHSSATIGTKLTKSIPLFRDQEALLQYQRELKDHVMQQTTVQHDLIQEVSGVLNRLIENSRQVRYRRNTVIQYYCENEYMVSAKSEQPYSRWIFRSQNCSYSDTNRDQQ